MKKLTLKTFLLILTTFLMTSCWPTLASRYHIPLIEGTFQSEELSEEISLVGLVEKAEAKYTEISKETYKDATNNVVRDYPGDTYFQIDFSLKTSNQDISFDMKYIGTNNNQPDSYRFDATYRLHKVIILLIVNEYSNSDVETLETLSLRFHIYEAGPNYTFRTDLYLIED